MNCQSFRNAFHVGCPDNTDSHIDDKFPNTVLFACDNVVFGLVGVVMDDAFAVML